ASSLVAPPRDAVGAAVLVLEAVDGLGLVGTSVVHIEDAVAVVVRVGAAVLVLEAVAVLGLVGAPVPRIGNAVAVAVQGDLRALGRGRSSQKDQREEQQPSDVHRGIIARRG